MEKRQGFGCDVNLGGFADVKPAKQLDKNLWTIAGDPVPKERVDAMIAYTQKLRKKFPHMSQERIKRKTAEHFKVKLI